MLSNHWVNAKRILSASLSNRKTTWHHGNQWLPGRGELNSHQRLPMLPGARSFTIIAQYWFATGTDLKMI